MIEEEVLENDYKERKLGGTAFHASGGANMVVDEETGKASWYDDSGNLIGQFGLLQGQDRVGLRIIDENGDNRFFNGRDGDFYGFSMSKPNADVFDQADADSIINSNVIFLESYFGTYVGGINASNIFAPGLVAYDQSDYNFIVRLPFYKSNDFVVTGAEIQVKIFDGSDLAADARSRLVDLDCILNPTTRTLEGITGGGDYVIYSGGSKLINDHDAVTDGDIQVVEFTDAQVALIDNGWNEIVAQQNATHTSAALAYGYLTINLRLTGYRQLNG
jgi:hypothetical protein